MRIAGLVAVYKPELMGAALQKRLASCERCIWFVFQNGPSGSCSQLEGAREILSGRNGGTAALVHWAQHLARIDTTIDAVWLLDQDTCFSEADLVTLEEILTSRPSVSGVVPRLESGGGDLEIVPASSDEWSPRPHLLSDAGAELRCAPLSGMLIRTAHLRSISLPPLELHLDWFDYALAEAFLHAGAPLHSAAAVQLKHQLGTQSPPRLWRGMQVNAPMYPTWRIRGAASNRTWLELRRSGSFRERIHRLRTRLASALWAAHFLATAPRADALAAAGAALEGTLHGLLTAWLERPAPYEGSSQGAAPGLDGWERPVV